MMTRACSKGMFNDFFLDNEEHMSIIDVIQMDELIMQYCISIPSSTSFA